MAENLSLKNDKTGTENTVFNQYSMKRPQIKMRESFSCGK
jgi:hypothetical protein